ncbi:DUF1858 domain-containing protein [candidate division WWE3 bacterium]|uniref:DUF1858 domain-containing protein n=1 Tax=candidate division WWE3 bacterium TaxID=2053526 RepID=A0A7X9DJZ7_UNCKA|nr:DUF1858 domain-containing protein [candidate division WWE3 bacterium]
MMEKKTNKKSKKELVNITKDMNLGEVVYKYPESAEVLTDYGLHCVGCFANAFDTIEAGAKIHGMSDDEIEEMIDRVNEVINFGE